MENAITLILRARDLRSEGNTNKEYDRALVELIHYATPAVPGLTFAEKRRLIELAVLS